MDEEPKDTEGEEPTPKSDDLDWLREAFDRANRGDNGRVDDVPPRELHEVTQPFTEAVDFPPIESSTHAWWTQPQAPEELADDSVQEPDSSDYFPPTEHLDTIDLPLTAEHEGMSAEDFPETFAPVHHDNPFDTAGQFFDLPLLQPDVRELPGSARAEFRWRDGGMYAGAAVAVVMLSLGGFAGGSAVGHALHPIETAKPLVIEPRPAGEWSWSQLNGGECLTSFPSAWEPTYTVVDCGKPHEAQLVYAGNLAADTGSTTYPGDDAIGTLTLERCSRKDIVDLSAAGSVTDLTIAVAYPTDATAWESGDTGYYCFATSASGSLPAASIAGKELTRHTQPEPTPTN